MALVILAGAGFALFSWINASIVSLGRVEEANARSEALANAIEFMQAVNPMAQPTGRADLGPYAIEWSTQPVVEPVDGTGYPRGLSLHQVALYEARVRASRPGEPQWFEFRLTLAGYKRVRELRNVL